MSDLATQANQVRAIADGALNLVSQLPNLATVPRQYVAEMVIVRLFAMFEAIAEDAACRMVCGARYCDGTSPALQRARPTNGYDRARNEMRLFGRITPHNLLRWGKAKDIKENLTHLFPLNEHFVDTLRGHGQFISDLRKVRNHIAHNNKGTRREFQDVVSNYYGAQVPGMTPGRMLLSNRFSPILVENFCRKTRIVLLSAIKAPP